VPVPASKADPNYTRLLNKQKAYDKVYNGKSCTMCPDEYATGKATKLGFSAAVCKPCASGQVPDAKHALCLGEYLSQANSAASTLCNLHGNLQECSTLSTCCGSVSTRVVLVVVHGARTFRWLTAQRLMLACVHPATCDIPRTKTAATGDRPCT
jgi:hypothetical protein